MNELAAAAAVMAMSVDDDGIDDLGLSTIRRGRARVVAVRSQCGLGWFRRHSWASANARWLSGSVSAGAASGSRPVIPSLRGDGQIMPIEKKTV